MQCHFELYVYQSFDFSENCWVRFFPQPAGVKLYTMKFFLNVYTEFSDKIFVIRVKGLKPVTSCVRVQDATTAPARHIWETVSWNWAHVEFAEITEFNESSAPFRKNSIESVKSPSFWTFFLVEKQGLLTGVMYLIGHEQIVYTKINYNTD